MSLRRTFRASLLPLAGVLTLVTLCPATEEKPKPQTTQEEQDAPRQEREGRRRSSRSRNNRRGGGFSRRGGFSKAGLLRIEKVREELKVTEEQQEKIEEAVAAMRSGQRSRRSRDEGDREARRRAYQEQQAKLDKAIAEILDEDQLKRLNGIQLQQMGVQGLTQPSTIAALALSDKQVEAIQEILDGMNERRRAAFREARENGDYDSAREAMRKIQEGASSGALAELTDEQKKKYDELKGEPIEIERRRFGGRRGARGGGDGRDGGRRGARRARPPVDDGA